MNITKPVKRLSHRAYFAINPQQGETITPRAHGIDISKYDLHFRPEEATGQLDFVVQRISYGITRDEAFDQLVYGVMQVPIRGGYHYLSSWIDWKLQADKFISYAAPYKYHFFNCDFEGAFNQLSTNFAYRAWNWIHYVEDKTGIPTTLYTSLNEYNTWIYPSGAEYRIEWNTVPLWLAQWFYVPDPNRTPTNPRGRTSGWKLWQYTDQGNGPLYGVARPAACDLDVYNGTVQEMKTWLNIGGEPIPPQDVITTAAGIQRVSGTRNGWRFELFISDPAVVRFESVCLSPLEAVSSVARRKGATLGINGGEWDRVNATKDYTVADGFICHTRVEAVPSLMILDNNTVFIDHRVTSNVRQALSGLRYLIQDGIIKSYLDGSEPQYTEGHARSVHGLDANGHHMVLQFTGVYPNQGPTLKQAAEVMQQYGALTAFDSGGGGDVTCYYDGQSLIVPENVLPDGTHFERALPNVFLIYAPIGGNMNGTAKEKGGRTSKVRTTPSRYGTEVSTISPYSTIEFVEVVPSIDTGAYASDKWFKLPNGNYVNYIISGQEYYTILTQPTTEPPPTTGPTVTGATIRFSDGTTQEMVPQ